MSGRPTIVPGKRLRVGRRALVGWLLLIPAVVLLIVQLVAPGVRTVLISLRGSTAFGGSRHRPLGVDGYRHAADLGAALAGSLACTALLLVAASIIGPLIGLLLARTSGVAERVSRSLLGLLICCYAPTAMLLGQLFRAGSTGVPGLMVDTLMIYLPVAVAGSALLWSAVFGAGTNTSSSGRAVSRPEVIVGAATVAIACLAGGLQSFEAPVLLAGGRMISTANLILYSLQSARFDTAAAVCTVLMIIVALLGILAGVLMIGTGTGLVVEFPDAADRGARRPEVWVGVAAVALPVLIVVAVVIFHRDWAAGLIQAGTDLPGPDGQLILQVLFNTWVPSGIGAVLQVVVALLTGFAIGYCQPLGRYSRWLLLGFAPWLFAGGLPLIVAEYDSRASARSEDWTTLIPSVWLVAPAIFVLSWLFADLRRHRDPLPIVGAALLTLVICWICQAQDLLRPMFLTSRTITAPMLSFRSVQTSFRADGTLWLVLPLPMLLSFAVIAAAAMIMLGRVRFVVRHRRRRTGPSAVQTVRTATATAGDRPADRRHVPPRPTS